MAYQTGRQIVVAFKEQTAIGTAETGSGAEVFRANSGGMNLTKTAIQSGENRRDGMMTRGRHGQRAVQGSYTADLSVGTFDTLMEAALRGTWAVALTIDDETVAMSSATLAVGANTITASAGSWITSGLRVGDVIRVTEGLNAASMNRNLRITGLTATVITVAETLTVEAGPLSTYTVTRSRKLIQGDPVVNRAFTIEEHEADIDGSEVFEWCRVGRMQIQLQPNNMGLITFDFVGRDMAIVEDSSAPGLTSPTATTTIGVTAVEAKILLGTDAIADLTGATIDLNLNAAGTEVVGSTLTPDVFTNLANITGSITGLRQDLDKVADFLAETQLSLSLMFVENESEPADFISFVLPNLTLASAEKSPLGQDGPRTATHQLMIGKDERGGAYDATMLKIQTSAA